MYRFFRKIFTLRKIRMYPGMDFWVRKTQKWWNFHGMVKCYGLMLRIAVTLRSNFLHLVTTLRRALVIQLCSVPTFTESYKLENCTKRLEFCEHSTYSSEFIKIIFKFICTMLLQSVYTGISLSSTVCTLGLPECRASLILGFSQDGQQYAWSFNWESEFCLQKHVENNF